MAIRSPRALEREFFRAFFAALIERKVTTVKWRDEDTSARFRHAVEWMETSLVEVPAEEGMESLRLLLRRLRPDPLTGATTALDRALMDLQFSDVSVSNPSYENVKLLVGVAEAQHILNGLSERHRSLITGMADVFLREDYGQRRAV